MKTLLGFILFLGFFLNNYSQTNSYNDKIKEINEFLLADDYLEAQYLLIDLKKSGFENANINYKLGICYLHSVKDKALAISQLEKASKEISPKYNPDDPSEKSAPNDAYLFLGDAYRINNDLEKAQKAYKTFLNLPSIGDKQRVAVQKRLKECLIAKVFMQKPLDVKFDNAGAKINSELANFNVCISGDGRKMVYTKKLKFYDAIYYATLEDSVWSLPENITNKIGSDGEFIPTSLSYDGTKLLLYSFSYPNGYDIFESKYTDGKWRKLKKLDPPINSKFNDVDACYAPDGKSIFFSSNRVESLGGFDIFKAAINNDNTIAVENIGNSINTIGDEKSPKLINNGNTLIYNSNYGLGMGGTDYYYSNLLENKWTEPYNLGYPMNSTDNDNDLSFTDTGNKGATAKHTANCHSDVDIFWLNYKDFSKFRTIQVNGKLQKNGAESTDMGERTMVVIDQTVKDTAYLVETEQDGSYSLELYPSDFNIIVKNKQQVETEQKFTIPTELSQNKYELTTNIIDKPKPLEIVYDTLILKDVLFDFNQSNLSESEKQMLARLLSKLNIKEITSITIIGYTDAIGNAEYNKTLSLQRANIIKSAFVEKGFSESVISTDGKGSSSYVALNTLRNGQDNPEGRSYNRRVEIDIKTNNPKLIIIKKERVPSYLKP